MLEVLHRSLYMSTDLKDLYHTCELSLSDCCLTYCKTMNSNSFRSLNKSSSFSIVQSKLAFFFKKILPLEH